MRSGRPGAHRLVAALLVLPLLALALGSFALHDGHACRFEDTCVACRWAADGVGEAVTTAVPVEPLAQVATVPVEPTCRLSDASPEAPSSRGPPLA
jgi:hypothetical protein